MTSGRPKKLTRSDVLQTIDNSATPFITSALIAEKHDCSQATALNRLKELENQGKVERYELDGRRSLYFPVDHKVATEFLRNFWKHINLEEIDLKHLESFAKEPYKILPKSEHEYYLVVPRFIPFYAGHLHEQDDAWQVFIINKYVAWIEELPEEIRKKVNLSKRYETAAVEDNILKLANEEEREKAWDDFGGRAGGLNKRVDRNKIQIQHGKEFDIIARLIEQGNIPFTTRPISDSQLRKKSRGVDLRSYQERAWEEFKEYGQIGVYWPPGTGKTFFALYTGNRIKGDKLVVVPTSTLEEQWRDRIEEFCDQPAEWEVRTYQYLTYGNNRLSEYQNGDAPTLTIFDECHRLPANTFSKLATIDTTYRVGLSASPYREDNRTDYIFALTGVPVGISWEELVEVGIVDYPTVWVYLYGTKQQKRDDAIALAQEKPGKGVIFCDDLKEGKELAEKLEVPHVSGDTPKGERVSTIRESRIAVVSRVGDEGMSLEDLEWTIEYDFHGGSRRQELQRTGRVMHGTEEGVHIVQMTDEEADQYSARLYSLEEKGMDLRYERRS